MNGTKVSRVHAALIVALVGSPYSACAAILDVTTANSTATDGVVIFSTNVTQATGTGGFNTFVQQSPAMGGTVSHAYNTTSNVLDNKNASNFNKSIFVADVPVVYLSGVPYRRFALDMQEDNGNGGEYLSLDDVQLFVGDTLNSGVDTFTGSELDHPDDLIYRLDAVEDSWVALNANLNAGSGSGDIFMYVPDALFAPYSDGDVVTLYTHFGGAGLNPVGAPAGDYGASSTFEEWGVPTAVPEPSTVLWLLTCGLVGRRVRRLA